MTIKYPPMADRKARSRQSHTPYDLAHLRRAEFARSRAEFARQNISLGQRLKELYK
jgi:hypothetical protein